MDYNQQAIDFLAKTNTEFSTEFLRFGSMDWDTDGKMRNIFLCTFTNQRGMMEITFGASIVDSCELKPKIEIDGPVEILFGISMQNFGFFFSHTIHTDTASLRKVRDGVITPDDLIPRGEVESRYEAYCKEYASETVRKRILRSVRFNGVEMDAKLPRILQAATRRIKECITELTEQTDYANIQANGEPKHPSAYAVLACIMHYDPYTFEDFCSNYGYDTDSRRAEKTYHACVEQWKDVCRIWSEDERELLAEIN